MNEMLTVLVLKEDASVWAPIFYKAWCASDIMFEQTMVFDRNDRLPAVKATIFSKDPYAKTFLKDAEFLRLLIDADIDFESV